MFDLIVGEADEGIVEGLPIDQRHLYPVEMLQLLLNIPVI